MKFLYLILFIVLAKVVCGQSTCPERLQEYKFTKEIYKDDEGRLNQEYAFLGMYEEAIFNESTPSLIDTGLSLSKLNTSGRYLDSIAVKRVVILNEAHNVLVSNRVFLYSIADSLWQMGFNDIFMEALTGPDDSLPSLALRKYPTSETGHYIQEPVFGEVIRKMVQLNMRLHAYEAGHEDPDTMIQNGRNYIINKNKPNWIPVEADTFVLHYLHDPERKRMVKQALNIYQTVLRLKINKVFIYSGFGNGSKAGALMGNFLSHLMHVEPYVIDQIILTERRDTIYEDPVYRKSSGLKNYYYLAKADGGAYHTTVNRFSKTSSNNSRDMIIGTPRTTYLHNRESWLVLNGDRHRYSLSDYVDTCTLDGDFLVVVYYEEEYNRHKKKASPEDVVQIFKKNGAYDLVLRPANQYHLFAFMDGKTVADKIFLAP